MRIGMPHSKLSATGFSRGLLAGRTFVALVMAAAILCTLPGLAQDKKKKDDHTRSVKGLVLEPDGKPVAGAVVQLKNTKTLQVRSYITQDDGSYRFEELSTDIDYELRADLHGVSSDAKSLSSFDTRKQATVDLKLKR
jgi:Carboxypeptidase regulatory-like domain